MAWTQQQIDSLGGGNPAVTPNQASNAYSNSNQFVQNLVPQTQQQEQTPSPFFSPLQNIASGNSQDNFQHAIGALKQIGSDISSVGAQNAGPVGKAMLANAPALAQDLQGLKTAVTPSNPEQKQGATDTSIAEAAIPIPEGDILGKAAEAAGQKLGEAFIPTSEKEAGILQNYKAGTTFADRIGSLLSGDSKAPTTAASAAFSKGLMGTESQMGVQATRAQGKLWTSMIKPALENSKTEVDMPSFFDQAEQKITSETNDPTRQKQLLNALDSVKEDFGSTGKVSMKQLQKYKEGWAEFVPDKAYKGQPIAGSVNDVRNTLAGMARDTIYKELGPDVRQAYLDYGNLNGIKKLGQSAMAGSKLKGGAGSMLHGLYEMATVPIGTVGGQTLYKAGQGLEFAGGAGAKTLGEVLGLAQQGASQTSQGQ